MVKMYDKIGVMSLLHNALPRGMGPIFKLKA